MDTTKIKRKGHDQSPKAREVAIRNWAIMRVRGCIAFINNCPHVGPNKKELIVKNLEIVEKDIRRNKLYAL